MDFEFIEVDSLDKVPEQLRPLYAQGQEGKFTLGDSYKGVKDVVIGLNKSLKAARAEAKAKTPVDLSPLADFGTDPASIKAAIEAKLLEAQTAGKQDVSKQIEGVKSALAQTHAKELEKHTARNTALQNQLYGLLVENEATTAVAELKGLPELLMPFIKNQVKVEEKDGKLFVQVVDAAGEIRYGATGSPMSIRELVTEMKANAKYGRLFESEQQAGGGGMNPGAGRQTPRTQGNQPLTANQKIAAGLAKMGVKR